MATIVACKFVFDIILVADYLIRKSAGHNLTLELNQTNNFYLLNLGDDCLSKIT